MTSRVGERGQITIEKAIREQLAIYAGDEAVQRVEDGRVVIEFVPGRHRRSLAGMLRDKAGRQPADESWEVLREAAWTTPDPAWSGGALGEADLEPSSGPEA
jgi:AbrB family looped-hinge helix DNA binding protein